jgi:hypothetical protein
MNMSVSASPAAARPISASVNPVAQRVFVSGRVTGGRTFQSKEGRIFIHLLKTKAADEYSHPGTLEVSSTHKLAGTGEEWEGFCDISGFPRSFEVKDQASGEISTVHTANMSLRAVSE